MLFPFWVGGYRPFSTLGENGVYRSMTLAKLEEHFGKLNEIVHENVHDYLLYLFHIHHACESHTYCSESFEKSIGGSISSKTLYSDLYLSRRS